MKPEQLKRLRLDNDLSVSEAARIVGISDRSWQRYESGQRKIPQGVVDDFKAWIEGPV